MKIALAIIFVLLAIPCFAGIPPIPFDGNGNPYPVNWNGTDWVFRTSDTHTEITGVVSVQFADSGVHLEDTNVQVSGTIDVRLTDTKVEVVGLVTDTNVFVTNFPVAISDTSVYVTNFPYSTTDTSVYVTNFPASSSDTHVEIVGVVTTTLTDTRMAIDGFTGSVTLTDTRVEVVGLTTDSSVKNYFNIGTDTTPTWSSENYNNDTNPVYVTLSSQFPNSVIVGGGTINVLGSVDISNRDTNVVVTNVVITRSETNPTMIFTSIPMSLCDSAAYEINLGSVYKEVRLFCDTVAVVTFDAESDPTVSSGDIIADDWITYIGVNVQYINVISYYGISSATRYFRVRAIK